jgi:hypothetical protein
MFKDAFVKAYHPRLIKFLALVSRLRKVLFFPMKQGIMSNKSPQSHAKANVQTK